MDRNEIRKSIDGLVAFKAQINSTDKERLTALLTQLEMAWHDFGYAKGERDGKLLAKEGK